MQNTNITNGDSLSDEVKIDLNVLGVLMLHRVRGHVYGTDVVAVHQCGAPKRGMQLQEKLTQPGRFCNCVSHRAILSFST
jgi:hypothetical protein